MNRAEIVHRLYRERQSWARGADGPEVRWTLRGLDIALNLVKTIAREETIRNEQRKPRLARWLAGDLFCAVNQGIIYIERGERGKALTVLRKAKAAAEETRATRTIKNGPFMRANNMVS